MGQPVYLQYKFGGGFDQKTAKIYLDPEQNLENVLNGNFSYVGTVDKRQGIWFDLSLGTALLLNATTIADAYLPPASNFTTLSGSDSVMFQQGFAWTLQGGEATYTGALPTCTVTRRPLPVQGSQVPLVVDGVVSSVGTVRVAAWVQNPGTGFYYINGAFLYPSTSAGCFTIPQLIIQAANVTLVGLLNLAGTVALFVVVEATGDTSRKLYCYTLNPLSTSAAVWTVQAGATLTLYNDDTTFCDVTPFVGDPASGYIVTYIAAASNTDLRYAYYAAFAQVSTAIVSSTSSGWASTPCYCQADYGTDVVFGAVNTAGDHIFLHWFSGDALFTLIAHYNVATSTISFGGMAANCTLTGLCRMGTPWLSAAGVASFNSQIYCSFFVNDTVGSLQPITCGGLFTRSAATTISPTNFAAYPAAMLPASKPFQPVDGLQVSASFVHAVQPCVQAWKSNSLQFTLYMVDWRVGPGATFDSDPLVHTANTEVTVMATAAPRQVDSFIGAWVNGTVGGNNIKQVFGCASSTSRAALVPVLVAATGLAGGTSDMGAHWLTSFVMSGIAQPTVVSINQTSQVSGSMPMRLLVSSMSEHGFIHYPEFISSTFTGTGLTGTYSYAVVYVRQDGNGNIERSSPAVLAAPVVPANQSVKLQFPLLSWWSNIMGNPEGYTVEIYRTLTLGSTYYCVARLLRTQITPVAGTLYWGSYTDSAADNTIRASEILYTTGLVLDNVNPPATSLHVAHRGRYAIVDETLRNVWFTKQTTQDEVVGFNEVLISPFPEGGDITGVSSMDDKFVVWKANAIQVQYGDGPADNGQNSDWTIPQPVVTDVGCINAASLATIPSGIIFQSAIGFHILTRSLEVQYIGKNVQDLVRAYPICVSSVVVPSAKQVRWCMTDGELQIILVYDYFLNQWTSHSYNYINQIVQLLLVNGVFTVIDKTGKRWVESASSWKDKDSAAALHFVPTTATLPWVKIQGAQGYMRARFIQLLCTVNDPCGVTMSLAFNYDAPAQQTKTWTYEAMAGGRRVETHVGAMWNKCESIQVTVTDSDVNNDSNTGQGMTFAAIGFDMEKIGDRYRRNPARLKG